MSTPAKPVIISIKFRSTYRLAAYYDVRSADGTSTREMKVQYDVPDYDRGGWNYTRDEFAREVAGSVGILHWTHAFGELVPQEIFEAFIAQYAINYPGLALTRGLYEPGRGWVREA